MTVSLGPTHIRLTLLHAKFPTADSFWSETKLWSAETLLNIPPASDHLKSILGKDILGDSEPWSHTHTFDVAESQVYVEVNAKLLLVGEISITGQLQWKYSVAEPEFSILRRLPDGEVFAASAVLNVVRPDELFALTISPNSKATGIHKIKLTHCCPR